MSLTTKKRVALLLIGTLPLTCMLLFGWMFSRAVVGAFAARDEASWMKVPATILKVDSEIYQAGRTGGVKRTCKYRYVVDGVSYEGSRISPSMLTSRKENEIIGCLREGDVIEIWVNLHDYSCATLSRCVGSTPLIVFGIGSFAGLFAVVFMIRNRKGFLRDMEISGVDGELVR